MRYGPMARGVKINDQTAQALRTIRFRSDAVAGECTVDAVKLIRQMMRDQLKGEGDLEKSVQIVRHGELAYEIRTNAKNPKGYGYGAAQEWGFFQKLRNGLRGKRIRGTHIIKRGFWGMKKRYDRGGKWEDKAPG